ncbi:hypothetical protein BDC45DRAFT_23740 [Circinella umbellata]|nr:hypothetical protein BDC45DRAFT_23740 [Circinella umbellata]
MMEHCLDLDGGCPVFVVKTNKKQKYTENDCFRIIWSRSFELLFNSSKVVRIKRESVPIFSTENKAELYPNDSNIIGFKIDARVVVDVDDNGHDIVSVEVAKGYQVGNVLSPLAMTTFDITMFRYTVAIVLLGPKIDWAVKIVHFL